VLVLIPAEDEMAGDIMTFLQFFRVNAVLWILLFLSAHPGGGRYIPSSSFISATMGAGTCGLRRPLLDLLTYVPSLVSYFM
jgi:hypothetical protein